MSVIKIRDLKLLFNVTNPSLKSRHSSLSRQVSGFFIQAISTAPLKSTALYSAEALQPPDTARVLWQRFKPKCHRQLRVKD